MDRYRVPVQFPPGGMPQARSRNSLILASGGYDNTVKFWDLPTGQSLRQLPFADSAVNCLRWTKDGNFIGAGGNSSVRIFDFNSSSATHAIAFEGHSGNVVALGFDRDSRWCWSASEDSRVRIWDMKTPVKQREFLAGAPINCGVMHPNQTMLISGDRNGTINMWDLVSNQCAHAVTPEPNNAIASVDVSRDGAYLAAATYNGNVYLWDLVGDMQHDPVAVTFFAAHSEYLLSLKFSPSCSVLLTTSGDNIAKLWSIPDGTYLKSFVGHQRWVWDSAFTYDSSYLITASSDHSVKLWDISTGDCIKQYNGHHKAVTAVALNDSNLL